MAVFLFKHLHWPLLKAGYLLDMTNKTLALNEDELLPPFYKK
jgi:hypothetical protein